MDLMMDLKIALYVLYFASLALILVIPYKLGREKKVVSSSEEHESRDLSEETANILQTTSTAERPLLTEDEREILKFLLRRNGEAYQSEIYRELNMPKSTVTRLLRRLSEKGVVRIERKGRYNYVRLVSKNIRLSSELTS